MRCTSDVFINNGFVYELLYSCPSARLPIFILTDFLSTLTLILIINSIPRVMAILWLKRCRDRQIDAFNARSFSFNHNHNAVSLQWHSLCECTSVQALNFQGNQQNRCILALIFNYNLAKRMHTDCCPIFKPKCSSVCSKCVISSL